MNVQERIEKAKSRVQAIHREHAKLEGELKSVEEALADSQKNLKEAYGVDTVEEAEKLLKAQQKELQKELVKLEEAADRAEKILKGDNNANTDD